MHEAGIAGSLYELLANFSEAPFALLIINYGLVKMLAPVVGPKDGGKVQFSIGQLPKQKIAQPLLSTGANQQLWIWNTGGT